MIDPRKYVVPRDASIEDVDLDVEEVHLRDGQRLTNELAEHLARQTLVGGARRRNLVPGRKSLTGESRMASRRGRKAWRSLPSVSARYVKRQRRPCPTWP